MAEPFLSEIRIVSFNYAPRSWAFCNGQFLPINQNQALFSLLGTTYGGNGQTTFALPNLRGQTPIHMGPGFTLGQTGGTTSVTISQLQMPAHNHFVQATNEKATTLTPTSASRLSNTAPTEFYSGQVSNLVTLSTGTISNVGGSQAHNNMQPYLVLNFCIALIGIFPSQN